jgi:hypothetical protein
LKIQSLGNIIILEALMKKSIEHLLALAVYGLLYLLLPRWKKEA